MLLLPSHEALEAATGRRHWAWLRAWAQFDRVLLQAPRTWAGRADDQLDELLLHELTHCLMYQRSATSDTWLRKRVPLWFREGLATVTADQGYRYPTLEAVAVWASEAQPSDLFGQAEALARRSSDLVYGFAHHALRFLVRRYGEESPVQLMDALASGLDFPDAFAAATGLSVARYEREFLNYLRLRGFRGAGLLTKHPSALPAAAPPPPPP